MLKDDFLMQSLNHESMMLSWSMVQENKYASLVNENGYISQRIYIFEEA